MGLEIMRAVVPLGESRRAEDRRGSSSPDTGRPAAPVGAPMSQGGRGASAEDRVGSVAGGSKVRGVVRSAVGGVDGWCATVASPSHPGSWFEQTAPSGRTSARILSRSVGCSAASGSSGSRAPPTGVRSSGTSGVGRGAVGTAGRRRRSRGGSVRASEVFGSDALLRGSVPASAVAPTGGEVSAGPRTERVEPAVSGGLRGPVGSSLGATSSRGTSRSSRPGTGSGRRSRSSGR